MKHLLAVALLVLVSGPAFAQSGTLFLSGGDVIGPNVVDVGALIPPPDAGNTVLQVTIDIGWQNEWCFETGSPGYYSVDLNPVNGWSLDLGWPAGEVRLMNGRAVAPHLGIATTGARFDGVLDYAGPSAFCNAVSATAAQRTTRIPVALLSAGQPLLLRTRSGANGPVFLYQSSPDMWNRVRNTWGASVQYRYLP